MTTCQNCGKLNTPETNFCRFCGTKLQAPPAYQPQPYQPQPQPQRMTNPYDHSPPKPYSWKTDEFQTNNSARKTDNFNVTPAPLAQNYRPAPLAFQQPQYGGQMQAAGHYAMDPNYRCPKCGTSYLPVLEKRISTAGWVTFALLLVFTFVFFWIGLLIKEDVAVCPVCRWRLN